MDEMNPAYENFLNNMSRLGGSPRETTRRVSASSFLGRDEKPTVEGNARKITLITNILRTRRINTGQMLSSLSGGSVKGVEQSIMDIKETMMSILATLQAQEKFEYEKFLDMQRRLENERRQKRESGLELDKKGLKLINSGVNRVLKPVRSIFSRVLSGIFNLIAGRLLIKLLNFFANPRNAAIVNFLSRFIQTFFPVLVAGVGAAAIGLGILTSGFTLATNLIRAASIGLGIVPTGTGVTSGLKDAGKLRGADINIFKSFGNVMKRVNFIGRKGFNKGGFVFGSGNTDSVPAMLTPGEVVISKPAVQRIGASNLLNLNREFGGTGRPSYRGGMPYAKEGMKVENKTSEIKKIITTKDLEGDDDPKVENIINATIDAAPNLDNKDIFKKLSDPSIPEGLEEIAKKFSMSKENQQRFANNIFATVIGKLFENLKPNKKDKDLKIKSNTNETDDLKPVERSNINQITSGFEGIGDIPLASTNSGINIDEENDVLDVNLNPADINKLETLGMVA